MRISHPLAVLILFTVCVQFKQWCTETDLTEVWTSVHLLTLTYTAPFQTQNASVISARVCGGKGGSLLRANESKIPHPRFHLNTEPYPVSETLRYEYKEI